MTTTKTRKKASITVRLQGTKVTRSVEHATVLHHWTGTKLDGDQEGESFSLMQEPDGSLWLLGYVWTPPNLKQVRGAPILVLNMGRGKRENVGWPITRAHAEDFKANGFAAIERMDDEEDEAIHRQWVAESRDAMRETA